MDYWCFYSNQVFWINALFNLIRLLDRKVQCNISLLPQQFFNGFGQCDLQALRVKIKHTWSIICIHPSARAWGKIKDFLKTKNLIVLWCYQWMFYYCHDDKFGYAVQRISQCNQILRGWFILQKSNSRVLFWDWLSPFSLMVLSE